MDRRDFKAMREKAEELKEKQEEEQFLERHKILKKRFVKTGRIHQFK
jgi:hypothetical protein